MAIDHWMLERLIAGTRSPTLRFYRWQPVALSLGYHQRQWPEHWRSLTWDGQPLSLVRRPTGGRAVLHQGDLTYAIALPMTSDRRQDCYRQICDALITAWANFGVDLTYGQAGGSYRHQANCFALATAADLVTSTGYKLIGSAQLRRDRWVLQHGSIRLWPDAEMHQQVFGNGLIGERPDAIPERFDEAWVQSLETQIGQALEQYLGVSFMPVPLTDADQRAAVQSYGDRAIP